MSSRILFCVIGILAVFASVGVSAQGNVENLITWNPIADPGVTEVLIYRSTTQEIADLVLVATVNSSVSSYVDTEETGAVPGTRYFYRLRSRNSAGSVSGFSAQISARYVTPSCPPEYQAECRINSVTSLEGTGWSVDWSTQAPSSCRLEYWKMGTTDVIVTDSETMTTTDHSALLTGLDPESIYFVRAIARSGDGVDMTVSCDFSFVTSDIQTAIDLVVGEQTLDIAEG
ncbi:MAG TPA: hypothetical protein VLA34_10070, partial [Candidatus Krumholzibacterium sp.]|nr:hypothetical protein [Candidatus Krumholzibacterium sp.]